VWEKGGFAAQRPTSSNALARAKVQSDLGDRTWRVPNSTKIATLDLKALGAQAFSAWRSDRGFECPALFVSRLGLQPIASVIGALIRSASSSPDERDA
jgi:hypothetical protein